MGWAAAQPLLLEIIVNTDETMNTEKYRHILIHYAKPPGKHLIGYTLFHFSCNIRRNEGWIKTFAQCFNNDIL